MHLSLSLSLSRYIYIYIYIYTCTYQFGADKSYEELTRLARDSAGSNYHKLPLSNLNVFIAQSKSG